MKVVAKFKENIFSDANGQSSLVGHVFPNAQRIQGNLDLDTYSNGEYLLNSFS